MAQNEAQVSMQTLEEVSAEHGQQAAQAAAEVFAATLRQLGYETTGEPVGVLSEG